MHHNRILKCELALAITGLAQVYKTEVLTFPTPLIAYFLQVSD